MTADSKKPKPGATTTPLGLRGRRALLAKQPWLTFVLPFAVFMLVGSLEPKPHGGPLTTGEKAAIQSAKGTAGDSVATGGLPAIGYAYYPLVYTIKIGLTVVAVLFVLPGYRLFPFRVTPWAVLAGVVGFVVWVGLCRLQWERKLLEPLGVGRFVALGARSGFNPLEQLSGNALYAWGFLAIRFFGLVMVVALIEEFFLRGFLMRFVMDAQWWEIPIGRVNATAVLAGTLAPVLTHPAELLAAAAWFSMITLLMVKTKSIWDCVVAHAVTNLLLGVYVVTCGQWQLM